MGRSPDQLRGLSASELQAAIAELELLAGARLLDVTPLAVVPAADDLLLVLQEPEGQKHFLHVALGGPRARVTTTARRFTRQDFARPPTRDALRRELEGAALTAVRAAAGERRCEFCFATANGERRLVVELFGARGLWALLDDAAQILLLSRQVTTAVRRLRPGDTYAPPPPAQPVRPPAGDSARFPPPVLPAIDAEFTAADLHAALEGELDALRRAAARARKKAADRTEGLHRQRDASARTAELRARADLMLAYAHTAARGATSLRVCSPETGAPLELELDPRRTVVEQANALYDRARRLDSGRAITEARLGEATAELEVLDRCAAALDVLTVDAADLDAHLAELRAELATLRAVPAAPTPARKPTRPRQTSPPGENFRRFVSAEGYPILVGRNNAQNDRLTLRVARGNDLWLHVGGGRAGSHVVVRLPKQKTASLETLLDAALLAVHFSKARGERAADVIYTQRKHVRKPKGLPPGAVVPAQTRTIAVELDEQRLRRLLDSAGEPD